MRDRVRRAPSRGRQASAGRRGAGRLAEAAAAARRPCAASAACSAAGFWRVRRVFMRALLLRRRASSSISGSSSSSPSAWGPYQAGAASQLKLFPGYLSFNKATWPSEKIGLAARIPFHASNGATPHKSLKVATAQSPAVLQPSTDRNTTTEGCFQAFPHATTAASKSLFRGTASRKRAQGRASFLSATRSTSQSSQSPTS